MNSIYFNLTNSQTEKLEPLFRQVYGAASQGENNRGVIFAQIKESGLGGNIRAKFVPAKYASRIIVIMKEMAEEEKSWETSKI